MITKEQIRQILAQVSYADTGRDIISLKMVQDLKVEGDKVSFSLIFQRADDPNIVPTKKACVQQLEANFDKIDIRGNIAVKILDLKANPPIFADVKNIVAIASGKGGVGKSTVAANLAVTLAKQGYKVGLLDADIFGPSMPKMFGVEQENVSIRTVGERDLIEPVEKYGVKMLSIGFFVNPNQATVWRGPMAGNALKQMMQDGDWGELDYLLIDLPPGTSDIHLTMVQGVSVTGAVIVSTPQDVALADAIKGIDMFESDAVNVPVLGLVENMAWFTPEELPENKYYIFGEGGAKRLAQDKNVSLLGEIPIVQSIRESGDMGAPIALKDEHPVAEAFATVAHNIVAAINRRNQDLPPTQVVEMNN
ncbi:ATP-binding protein involved in chromosome partitioning [Balneicella halophila]|uniref:Iron-sulfur cluster carrier protein n=1 Tax=Balneicella halophila TaxID=1537566 RepID=A0A7L4URE9_BALHA|nr:Mrp/NBP35 family ATP-binding protein [Balneicella halophila]PVX52239.1 ATP-binding protein involved in chromosome partitioning [Balneicella halophila]